MLGATAAAWWPGRAVARVPVTLALSARPPRPKPAHRSAMLAALLIAGGVGSLAFSDRDEQAPDRRRATGDDSRRAPPRVLWRSASSPGPPVTSPSPHGWPYGISPATRPAPGLHSPRSRSRSASQRRWSSPRRQRRSGTTSGWRPSPPISPTARSGCTPVRTRDPQLIPLPLQHPPSSHGVLRASASSRQVSLTLS